ncbi:MAG TPA: MarR family transcriptional regulator [Candidatus Gemmiger faecigallinarum]|nr:MarR family transcriptional regulator [Candidatus Gemmiger faecigallinarum]
MDYRLLAEQLLDQHASLHRSTISQNLSALDRGGFFLLNYLVLHQGSAHPRELSRGMSVSTARIAALLNHLEKQGLVVRSPDSADSRQIVVTLTEAGCERVRRKRQEITDLLAQTLAELGPEDARTLLRIRQKMICNLQRHVEQGAQPRPATGKEAPASVS